MALTLGLARVTALLRALGSPHLSVPCVHIAGTNGKGSVSAFLDSILRSSGLRTGRFNSPHFLSVHDSVLLNGTPIQESLYRSLRDEVVASDLQHQIQASPFELLTATAFLAFSRASPPLDVAVLEVGLGGAEDATNVICTPLLSIITPIDLDHQAILGNTLREIAFQKAGIIKQDRPTVVASQHPDALEVVHQTANEKNSQVTSAVPAQTTSAGDMHQWIYEDIQLQLRIPLPGPHQLENAGVALTAAQVLRSNDSCRHAVPALSGLSDQSMIDGIEATSWAGRLQWLQVPLPSGRSIRILADGAHNPASARNLRSFVDSLSAPSSPQPTTWILGCSAPRAPETLLRPLLRQSDCLIACQFTILPEGMPWVKPTDPEEVAAAAQKIGIEQVQSTNSLYEALQKLDEHNQLPAQVVLAGSLYLVADLYRVPGICVL